MPQPLALVWDLVARDAASPTFARVAASADKAAVATNRAAGGAASFGKRATAALGALLTIDFGVHAAKEAAQFERSMLLIQTQAGASADEVRSMSKAVLALAGPLGTSPEKLAVSLYHAYSVTKNQTAALNIMKIAAEGAKVGNADLEETTNALTSTVASGIGGVKDMSQAMGALNAIVGAGDMKLSDLNEALGSGILTIARTYNVSLTQAGAALAVFGDNNIRGADAATALRMAIQDLARPAHGADEVLRQVGLTSANLKKDLAKGGLTTALQDLSSHMTAAGVTAGKVGPFIVSAFTKRAGAGLSVLLSQMDRYNLKLQQVGAGAGRFGADWKATTKTAAFAFDQLRASLDVASIAIGTKILPAASAVARFFTGQLGPALVGPWHALEEVLSVVGEVLHGVGSVFASLNLPIGGIAVAIGGAVLAFKAMTAVVARGGLIDGLALRLMYAGDATARFGSSAKAMATSFTASSTAVAASAEATAGSVAASGTVASIGWRAVLGPLVAVGVGVGLLVSLFHRSSGASKEAAAAAKAYTDALRGDNAGSRTTLVDAIVTQLADNNVPQKIAKLNKLLGGTKFTGQQFVSAIESGGKPLATLRARLEAVAAAGNHMVVSVGSKGGGAISGTISKASKAATKLLADLNSQSAGLSKAIQKDLADTKAFAGVSSSIDKVSESTKVGSETAKRYVAMLGIFVDKNGVAAVSAKTLQKAIETVSNAYDSASQSGSEFLSALQQFSQSAGTAADRAALIGATLKAANGDALAFAASMTGTTTAINGLVDAFKEQRQQLAQQSADAQAAAGGVTKANRAVETSNARLAAAQARLAHVQGNPKSTAAQIASAQAAVTSAQNAAANSADRLSAAQTGAGAAGALAYRDTERAAIHFKKTADGLAASIDTNAKGAGDLVSQLTAMQSAAMGAAGAMFQHEVATKGAKKAADDAYNIYVTKTSRSLIDEHKKLGLTRKQAKALADQYFGMPKTVKTQIEAEGTNPILTVLNKIGALLAHITGQEWNVKVKAVVSTVYRTKAGTKVSDPRLGGFDLPIVPGGSKSTDPRLLEPHAAGGMLSRSRYNLVGEYEPEIIGPDGRVYNGRQSRTAMPNRMKEVPSVTVNQTFNEAMPERPSISGPAAIRKAATAIGRTL